MREKTTEVKRCKDSFRDKSTNMPSKSSYPLSLTGCKRPAAFKKKNCHHKTAEGL